MVIHLLHLRREKGIVHPHSLGTRSAVYAAAAPGAPTRSQATWRAPQPAERRCPPLCTLALPVCAHTGTTHIRQNAVIAGSYWGKGRAQNDARIVQIRCAEHVVDTRLSRMLLSHNLLRGALATRTYVSTLGAGRRRRYLAAPKGGGSHWPSLRFILSL